MVAPSPRPAGGPGPGGRPVDVGGATPRALLTLLLGRCRPRVVREWIDNTLWGDDPPPTVTGTLQAYVSALAPGPGAGARPARRRGRSCSPAGRATCLQDRRRRSWNCCASPTWWRRGTARSPPGTPTAGSAARRGPCSLAGRALAELGDQPSGRRRTAAADRTAVAPPSGAATPCSPRAAPRPPSPTCSGWSPRTRCASGSGPA